MADGHVNVCKGCRIKYEADWRSRNRAQSVAICARATAKYLATPHGKANRTRLQREREAVQEKATPAWANRFFIEEVYEAAADRNAIRACGTQWEVDHIVPLISPLVCGLHTDANLRIITAFDNRSKRNRHWPDMPRAA